MTRPATLAVLLALLLGGLVAVSARADDWRAPHPAAFYRNTPTRTRAAAENYGSVTPAYHARMVRMAHLWFDKHGVGGVMSCVMDRESGGNPRAYNDNDYPGQAVAGLWQIAWPLWTANNPRAPYRIKRFWHFRYVSWAGFRERLADPVQSVRLAYILYRHSGLGPWMAPGGC